VSPLGHASEHIKKEKKERKKRKKKSGLIMIIRSCTFSSPRSKKSARIMSLAHSAAREAFSRESVGKQ